MGMCQLIIRAIKSHRPPNKINREDVSPMLPVVLPTVLCATLKYSLITCLALCPALNSVFNTLKAVAPVVPSGMGIMPKVIASLRAFWIPCADPLFVAPTGCPQKDAWRLIHWPGGLRQYPGSPWMVIGKGEVHTGQVVQLSEFHRGKYDLGAGCKNNE